MILKVLCVSNEFYCYYEHYFSVEHLRGKEIKVRINWSTNKQYRQVKKVMEVFHHSDISEEEIFMTQGCWNDINILKNKYMMRQTYAEMILR